VPEKLKDLADQCQVSQYDRGSHERKSQAALLDKEQGQNHEGDNEKQKPKLPGVVPYGYPGFYETAWLLPHGLRFSIFDSMGGLPGTHQAGQQDS
jgi:hypothetical protein